MNDITGRFEGCDISGYLHPIEINASWVSYRDPRFPVDSASLKEQRYNQEGQAAFYIASGVDTAKLNVPDWGTKTKYTVAPQVLNCFDLPRFAKDQGLFEDYLISKKEGGYPLPQETADYLLYRHGITGLIYASVPDYRQQKEGLCLVVRPQSGRLVGEDFFVTGAL